MAAQEIKVPDIGDFEEVEVIEVLVSEGDEVEKEQALITLESDKATLEVPSSSAGKITQLKIAEGDKVSEGDVIAVVEAGGDEGTSADEDAAEAEPAGEGGVAKQAGSQRAADEAVTENGGETVEVKVPDIGDFEQVEVIEVLAAEGDEIAAEQPLITLESDKATLQVPSSAAGTIRQLKVSEGDQVSEGDVIALLETAGGDRPEQPKQSPSIGTKPEPIESQAEETTEATARAPGRSGKNAPQDDRQSAP